MEAYNKDILDWKTFPEYDIIWCDPPWQQRMVKFFETMMFKNGQKKPNNTIEEIIKHLAVKAKKYKPVFIEYSVKGSDLIIDLMINKNHNFTGKVFSKQENGNPYCILVFNTSGFLPNGDKQGFKIIDDTCENLKFNIVFDPFAGIGKTGKKFIKNGKKYIGSEINTKRFEKLKQVLWQEQ